MKNKQKNKSSTQKLTHPFRFALGMLGTSIAMSMASRANFFYSEFWGLGFQYISIVNVIYTFWDAINDPLAGYLSDRTRTKYGRRRPWMLLAAPLYLICSVLFFTPPAGIMNHVIMTAVYYGVFRILGETFGTILTINYHSLLPELFKDDKRRNVTNAMRQMLQIIGMIIGITMVPIVVDKWGYAQVALVTGILGMGSFVYCACGCKEDPEYSSTEKVHLLDSVKTMLKNKNFWFIGIAHLCLDATQRLTLEGIPFFVKYSLKGEQSHESVLSGAIFGVTLISIPFVAMIVNKVGAKPVWRLSMLGLSLSFVLMFFMPTLLTCVIAGIFIGIFLAGLTATLDLIQSRLMDEDAQKTGLHREGLIFSILTFFRKLSGLIISLIFIVIFNVFKFESGLNPGPNPEMATRVMITMAPAILMFIGFIISGFTKFINNADEKVLITK